jgi:methyl-accepting chemotaxis protein
VRLTNLKITPKLGILVGVTLLGLSAAGLLAGYLMQQEMMAARIDQVRVIVDMGRTLALGLQKQVAAGEMTKEAALAEFGRRANSMTWDNGTGYLFGTDYNGVTVLAPDPKDVGINRMNVLSNGRAITRERLANVLATGEDTMFYDFVKPGQSVPLRKYAYSVAIPGWNMFIGAGAYLDDLDAKMRPIAWLLGLSILGIAVLGGGIAWMIGRSISRPLGLLGTRMQALADGALDGDIPGIGRGDEVGEMAATVQIFKDNALRIRGLEQAEQETSKRVAAERRAAMETIASDFEHSVTGVVRSVSSAATGMQTTAQSMTSTASDASARAATVSAASKTASDQVGTVAAAAEELSSSVAEISRQVARSSEIAGKAVSDAESTNATVRALSTGAEKIGEDQSARAQRHHRGGARRRFRPRLRGGGVRGQGAGQPDCQGNRGNRRAGGGDAGFDQRRGGLDRRHHRDHRADERDHRQYLHRGGAAGQCDPRDRAEHPVGRRRLERDQRPYRRRDHRRRRDRECSVRRAVECPRTRHPIRHAAQRGRRFPGQGPRGVSRAQRDG